MKFKIISYLLSILCILILGHSSAQVSNTENQESYPLLVDTILGKPLSEYMTNPDIDQRDKDFILGKVEITNEDWFNSVLTKLSTISKSQEAFYLHILNVIVLEVDGAPAEVVGSYVKHFLLRSSKVFCEFFSSYEGPEREKLLRNYAGFLSQEFSYAENPEEAFMDFEKKVKQNCRLYKKSSKEFSSQFLTSIEVNME